MADGLDLERRLRREVEGESMFDAFDRGRYSTDASVYQIEPVGVVVPRHLPDVIRTIQIAADAGVPVIPRGAGTSQSGQAIGQGLILDTSKYLTEVEDLDPANRSVAVGPGVVLDELNRRLRPYGLWFPVDVSTSAQATLGGMAGNNSAGTRSIRYGLMVDNVRAIDAVLADGSEVRFGPIDGAPMAAAASDASARGADLVSRMRALHARETDEIERRWPRVLRNVAGYNLNRLGRVPMNMADLLVGSEGTLALFTRLHLALQPLPRHRVLGVCHFPTLTSALDAARHVVELGPSAVELVDRGMIDLARAIPTFESAIARFVRGAPAALLLVEFAGDDDELCRRSLEHLGQLMGTLGFPDGLVRAIDPSFQAEVWGVRKAGLNIVMSMKGDGKPVSFIEDCAVPLEHLAEYADLLTEIFRRHGTSGTWYAHASVGCLHVRPILNLKCADGVRAMRGIAEEAHELVRRFKGSHSGEHGDGLVRSEFLEPMLGRRLVRAFEHIKDAFDPDGVLNPGKVVRSTRMDDRGIMRFRPDYAAEPVEEALDWSAWGGLAGAVEMCNNNGACRKLDAGVMCPSYRVTRDEQHTTRGRANALRLAITGQLGPGALESDAMHAAMDLCIGCKACRRECPTGVDMARMKTEFLYQRHRRHGVSPKDRLIAYLPRYAPSAVRMHRLFNLPSRSRLFATLAERTLGLSAQRQLPTWRSDPFRATEIVTDADGPEVLLLVDTFSRYFEPEVARAACVVLRRFGYRIIPAEPADGGRPLCCGRTFLNVGLVDEARQEARRLLEALVPYARRGVPIVGLEPSCLLTLRDEMLAMLPGPDAEVVKDRAMLIDELLAFDVGDGRSIPPLAQIPAGSVLVHGHCHQKAFGINAPTLEMLRWIPDVAVAPIQSGCCGMAGSFGYDARHYDISMKMGELDLLPTVRSADPDAWIAASGTSCRRQIQDGTGRDALHPIQVLQRALADQAIT